MLRYNCVKICGIFVYALYISYPYFLVVYLNRFGALWMKLEGVMPVTYCCENKHVGLKLAAPSQIIEIKQKRALDKVRDSLLVDRD